MSGTGWSWTFFPRRLRTVEAYLDLSREDRGVLAELYAAADKWGRGPGDRMALIQALAIVDGFDARPSIARLEVAGFVRQWTLDGHRYWALTMYDEDAPSELIRRRSGLSIYPREGDKPEVRRAPKASGQNADPSGQNADSSGQNADPSGRHPDKTPNPPDAIRTPSGQNAETYGLDETRRDETRAAPPRAPAPRPTPPGSTDAHARIARASGQQAPPASASATNAPPASSAPPPALGAREAPRRRPIPRDEAPTQRWARETLEREQREREEAAELERQRILAGEFEPPTPEEVAAHEARMAAEDKAREEALERERYEQDQEMPVDYGYEPTEAEIERQFAAMAARGSA